MTGSPWAKVKRWFPRTTQEWTDLIIVSIVAGFILSFNKWGTTTFDVGMGIVSWIGASILAALMFAVHHVAQRLIALHLDTRVEQRAWLGGMVAGVLLTLITHGIVPFIAFTRTTFHELPVQRLGHFRYKSGTFIKMWTAVAGPMANLVVGFVCWSLVNTTPALNSPIMISFISMNVLFAILNLLPIPPLDGIHVFFAARVVYAVAVGAMLGGGIAYLIGATGILFIGISLAVSIAAGVAWNKYLE